MKRSRDLTSISGYPHMPIAPKSVEEYTVICFKTSSEGCAIQVPGGLGWLFGVPRHEVWEEDSPGADPAQSSHVGMNLMRGKALGKTESSFSPPLGEEFFLVKIWFRKK